MKRLFFLLVCLFLPLYGYEAFQIIHQEKSLTITKPFGFLDKPLSSKEALSAFQTGIFQDIPQESRSFGFRNHSIWLGVEIENSDKDKLFLSFDNPLLEYVEYFIYQGDNLISKGLTGAAIPISERSVQNYDLRIPLLEQNQPLSYLIKITSTTPLITSAIIGTDGEIKSSKLPMIIMVSLFSGIFFALFLYNGILYFVTKQKDFLLYSLYIFSLFSLALHVNNFFGLFQNSAIPFSNMIKLFNLQIALFLLVLFTLTFLNIKKFSIKLYYTSLYISGFVTLLLSTVFFGNIGEYICTFAIVFTLIWVMTLAVYAKVHHTTLANYYLIAVGGFFISIFGLIFMFFGFIPYSTLQYTLPMLGSTWEMILFSLAIGYKIRSLSLENTKALMQIEAQNKMLFLQSRYTSVGELIRNITHQWKEPLGEIGAIQTNLKSTLLFQGSVSKEKLLNAIELNHNIISHLAETIDTFYRFFRSQSNEQHEFNVIKEIDNIKKIVKYTFETEQIELKFTFDKPYITLYGNPNEFSHAILNIILNAKEVLIKREILNPYVHIHIATTKTDTLITISDNAGGITQQPLEKIFDIGTSSYEENIGLGLFISKTIIEQKMRGHVYVSNTKEGARFILSLPIPTHDFIPVQEQHLPLIDIEANTLQRISKLEKDIQKHIEVEKNLQHWAHIFEKAHWGIAIYEATSRKLTLMNPAFMSMYGYTEEEFLHSSFSSLFTQDWVDSLDEVFDILHKTHQYTFEAEHIRKNGTSFPVDLDMIVVTTESNTPLYYILNVRDITHYKQTHTRLLLKNYALNQTNEATYIMVNERFIQVNDGACKMLGYTREEFASMSLYDIDPDTNPDEIASLVQDMKTIGTMRFERKHRTKEGDIIDVEISASFFKYEGIDYSFAVARDIRERRELEAQKDNERMRLFFEKQLIGMAITSPEKNWLNVNGKLCEILGYTQEELLHQSWENITYPEDLESDTKELERVLRGEIEGFSLKKRFIHKDGNLIYTNFSTTCVRREDGSANYFLTLIEDITEQIIAEKALIEKNEELQKTVELNESIIHAIPDLLLEITSDGIYVGIWAQDEKILVQQKELLLGKNFKDILPENAKNAAIKTIQEVDEHGFSIGNTYSLDFPDGKRWFELSMSKRKSSNTYMILARDITPRKLAQDALMELTQTLEDRVARRTQELQNALSFNEGIINAIPDLLFELDISGTYLNVWTQDEKSLAKQKKLLLGKTLHDVLLPEAADTVMKGIKEADVKGSSSGHIIKIELPHGTKYFEESISKKIPENTFIILSRDITDRQNAEIALRVREEKFSKLFKLSPAAISITSLETGAYLEVNDSFLYYTKYSYEEVIGKSSAELSIFVNPKDREDFFHQITQYGFIKDFEYSFRAKDGSIGYAIAYASTIMYKGTHCLIGHSYDMSDRKKFRQSEEAFRAIVENSPDVVARYDLEYRRTYVNPRMQQLLNKPMEEIIGFKPSEHTPLPQNIDFEALLERVAKEKVERHFITPYIMPNGDERWGDIRVIPEFNEKKEVMSILMIGKDLDTYVPPPKLQPHLFSSKE
ncbi:MAG TPA: hypothetical protein CFH79_05160 [Sulfurospirillum sp. UBA11407]|nr:MAG TPA: hypothetical protein CFH79_05160 [Sulfurospirillum sp. UBA11407]